MLLKEGTKRACTKNASTYSAAPPVRIDKTRELRKQVASAGLAMALAVCPAAAFAAPKIPPIMESPDRCTLEALDKFADTRANFSMEASSGAMGEALVDLRGCDFSGKDMRPKVLSGVLMQDSNFKGANLAGLQLSRTDARGADLSNANLGNINAFGASFDGADLTGVNFENAVLSSASFGKWNGKWAQLNGAHFEGALMSSSDVVRICDNPTIDEEVRLFELGCRPPR